MAGGLPARDPVAGIFDFGEKGGIAAPGGDTFAPFGGFTMGPGVRGGALPMGPVLGDSAATYRKGNMWGFDQDNGAIVRQYVSSHKSIPALKEDTGVGHLLYGCNPRMKKHILAKERGRARKDDPTFQGVREPIEFKSLSRLNRWLRSKEGREMFGKDKDCLRFRQMYRLAGGQITKAHDSLNSNDEFVLAIVTARRFRTKDFTLIDGKGAQMNDVVFIVWRRFKYTGVPLPEVSRPSPAPFSKSDFGKIIQRRAKRIAAGVEDADGDEDMLDEKHSDAAAEDRLKERVRQLKEAEAAHKTPDVLKKALGMRPVEEPGVVADKPEEEYYWRGDMWYGPRGTQPNSALYLPDNGSFIGDIDFVGYVHERYGDRSQIMVNQANAREALHPSGDSDDWKKAFVALPDLDIHLKIR
jgi:hypothetical protein